MKLFQKLRAATRRPLPAAVPLPASAIALRGGSQPVPLELDFGRSREGTVIHPHNKYEVLCGRSL